MIFSYRPFLVIVASAFLVSSTGIAPAEDAKPRSLTVESAQPITLNSVDSAQPPQSSDIRLKVSNGPAPAALEMIEARLDKHATNFASAFGFGAVQGTPPNLTVRLDIDLKKLPFAGKYTAKVRTVEPAAAAGQTAEPAVEIAMTFERSAAELVSVAEFVLERDALSGKIDPGALYITEKSNVAFAKFAFPLVSEQLRGPLGQVLPAQIDFSSEGTLNSGQRLSLKPEANGSFPLGASTGTVQLDSPQLAAPVELKFKLVNRHWVGWLPLTIIAFILLGFLYRKLLADRQELDEGLLDAGRAFARLKDIADRQVEPQLKSSIEAEIASLAAAMSQAESATALRDAATKAGTAIDTILAAAAESRRTSRTKIADLKSALGRPELHTPEIAKIIEDANRQLDEFVQGLDRGLAQSLAPPLAKLDSDLQAKLPKLIESLTTAIKSDLQQIRTWPETEIDSEAAALTGILNEAEKVAQTDLAKTVSASALVTRTARLFFTRTLRSQSTDVARKTVTALGLSGNEPDFAAVRRIQEQILANGPLVNREAPYHEIAGLVSSLRDALAALVRKIAPANTAAVEDALGTGNFVLAAKAAKAAAAAAAKQAQAGKKVEAYGPVVAAGGEAAAGPGKVVDFLSGNVMVPGDRLPPVPTLSIGAPAEAQTGQIVELRALIQPAIENATFTWTVVAGTIGQEKREGAHFSFSPLASGPVIVKCEATGVPQGRLSAQVSIQVARTAAEQAIVTIRERMTWREWKMSAITGLFIAGAGTMIFADAFVGSWKDFLFAALWGFTADVGTGRLRALAEPLTSKQIPGLGAAAPAANPAQGGAGH
jgi:hypothetical protein